MKVLQKEKGRKRSQWWKVRQEGKNLWMESWATQCSGGKRNALKVILNEEKQSAKGKCKQKKNMTHTGGSGCTLLELCTESHRSRSANPSWQWKRLTESLVLLFPLPSIYVWQMFPPDAPVYVWVPRQLPPGCDFHLSRVAEGKKYKHHSEPQEPADRQQPQKPEIENTQKLHFCSWSDQVVSLRYLQPLTRLQLNNVGLICEGCSVTINFEQLIWHI